jgi:hypothetical protein
MKFWAGLAALVLGVGVAAGDRAADLAAVRGVGPDGRGSAEAARAWKCLAEAEVRDLPALLAGMDGANPVARNWLRAAVDRVLERAAAAKAPLPAGELEAFLRDTRHDPQARRLAYELVCRVDKAAPGRLLPGLLDDPSADLRRDAVARVLGEADAAFKAGKKADALPLYRRALAAAREKAQIAQAARRLRDLGQPVDLAAVLGMVLDWKVIGPFPNPDGKGADTPYPPEKKLDFTASYPGKGGQVRWADYASADDYGLVDVNAALARCLPADAGKPGPFTEAVGYAATEFTSKQAREVEIRLGSFTAFKLWVNGEPVLTRGDAYTGMELDHYVARARLRPGKNTLLLKLWIDTPPPQLPKIWRFQLRVCDAQGTAVLSATRPPRVEKKTP